MCRAKSVCLSVALLGKIALGQSTAADSSTLQSLLAEVRQLREVLQTTTIAAQRIQIALYRLQIQGQAVARLTQRYDDVRSKVADVEFTRKRLAANVESMENLQTQTEDPKERKNKEVDLSRQKKELEMWMGQEQQLLAMKSEVFAEIQAEQVKLGALQESLDRLDKTLANFGSH
jgi:hypothetical protein